MNIYLVVEGIGERKIYPHWIPMVNPNLRVVDSLDDVTNDCVYIVSGMGHPQYFGVISAAIADVQADPRFDKLVVSVDSEDMDFQDKYDEIEQYIQLEAGKTPINYSIIIQHFCIETWALGHPTFFPRTNGTDLFKKYRAFFNVRVDDPETLPAYPPEELNRAQFAAKYLRAGITSRYGRLTHSKSNPTTLTHPKYFENIRDRLKKTGHISSFEAFLHAFQ